MNLPYKLSTPTARRNNFSIFIHWDYLYDPIFSCRYHSGYCRVFSTKTH